MENEPLLRADRSSILVIGVIRDWRLLRFCPSVRLSGLRDIYRANRPQELLFIADDANDTGPARWSAP
jgi:hypothetical protein